MKSQYRFFHSLIIIIAIITACSRKQDYLPIDRPIDNSQYFINNREYFWGESWQRRPSGYEMTLQTQMLTDSVINKGIGVGVRIYSERGRFETLPVTIDDPSWLTDTIQLSCTVTPGKLKVFAKTSVNITWPSDVYIQF